MNGDTSDATDINTPIADIAADLNIARPIVAGGTGATSASGARTALGLAIGTNVQAYDAALTSIAALGTAADKGVYFTAADTAAEFDLTAAGRALLDDADAAAQRTTLGLGTSAVATLLDEDDMSSDSATGVPSQQSVKAYVDALATPSAGDVGTYVWAYKTSAGNTVFGATEAGADLRPTGAPYEITNFASSHGTSTLLSGSALSGTWQCMGYFDKQVGVNPNLDGATLWLRIA